MSVVLVMRGLVAGHPGLPLVRIERLEISCGEIVGIHGPSGCGKSTLLRTLAGLIDPIEGEVLLDGRRPEVHGWPAYRRSVVRVEQQPVLLDGPVERSLRRPFEFKSAVSKEYPTPEARRLLGSLGLPEDVERKPARELSVGQQHRVALVRALLLEPRVLLLDEPTAALDDGSAAELERLLAGLAAEGLAVLLVTHQIERARRWCHRIEPLFGRTAAEGTEDAGSDGERGSRP